MKQFRVIVKRGVTLNKQALMIYNPVSGKKKNHKYTDMLIKKLNDIGYEITVHSSIEMKQNGNAIREACENNWDAIFIAGGDGTINDTLQHLAEQEYRPTVGIFPFGTSNEFAKFIGIPSNIEESVSVIEKGKTKSIDIGKFGNQYFANIAAAGWLTDITYKTSPLLKSYFGELAYSIYFIKTLLLTKPPGEISIRVSPHVELSDLSIFLIMNGNSVGPLERIINTTTHANDGYFHLFTCKNTNRLKLLFALLAKMLHLTETVAPLDYYKVHSASFSIPDNLFVNLDGDQVDVYSTEFEVLPNYLHVFIPDKE
ncbi:diacylglycerol/lipid kinase family protein [Virgibacillus proomii]|uniref:diacylglycerol/lipid kinase family protein n=1 Tax=Virgibacillus proomii TaxID=84407 RepID=UPI001FEB8637|nr:YegS/Rv2252/BmrU family lipid kinase [Virgibacillus proomii]